MARCQSVERAGLRHQRRLPALGRLLHEQLGKRNAARRFSKAQPRYGYKDFVFVGARSIDFCYR